MTLSRTARILIAVLLLAAAAFFWVNFFSQEQPAPAPLTTQAPAGGTATTTPAATASAGSTGKSATPVVAPNRPAVATRELQVTALPFLVTSPPAATTPPAAASGTGSATSTASPGTAQASAPAQRMNVNPFSPIVVQAPPAPAATTQASAKPPAPQKVTTAAAPASVASAPAKLAEAPAPQPVAPPPPQASGLPHALPSGVLPSTPSVLTSARAQATSSAPKDLGAVAALVEPSATGPSGSGTLGAVSQAGMLASTPGLPAVLGPGQPTKPAPQPKPAPQKTQATTSTGPAPLQAGTDALSRYLRDHNVRFTGTVLGPISVGVFRSSQYKMPVVVSLGQDLPETKITLTDLRGHEAVFTLNDTTQSLSLDLRR